MLRTVYIWLLKTWARTSFFDFDTFPYRLCADTGVWKRGRKALHTFLTPEAITEYLPLQQVEFVQFLHDNLVKPNVRFSSLYHCRRP